MWDKWLRHFTINESFNGTVRRIISCKSFDSAVLIYVSFIHRYLLAHVVNLGNVNVMACITRIAAVETTITIWEYDPSLLDNCMLNGLLNVIAAIRTLAIKVCLNLELCSLIQISSGSFLATDSGIRSVNWTVWKASDQVWHHGSFEDSPSQQCPMGTAFNMLNR